MSLLCLPFSGDFISRNYFDFTMQDRVLVTMTTRHVTQKGERGVVGPENHGHCNKGYQSDQVGNPKENNAKPFPSYKNYQIIIFLPFELMFRWRIINLIP